MDFEAAKELAKRLPGSVIRRRESLDINGLLQEDFAVILEEGQLDGECERADRKNQIMGVEAVRESTEAVRFVSPPVDQLDKLRQPLTKGELAVFHFFDKHLPKEWEIYIQPHLNGLRPDFVLLNPKVGIGVFEVKDWNLDAMDYSMKVRSGKAPELRAFDGKINFSLQRDNPVEKVHLYKQEIFDLYCPRLKKEGGRGGFAAITSGIIFPYANEGHLKNLFCESLKYRDMDKYPQYNPISGIESIHREDLSSVFPESKRKSSEVMSEDLANDLRSWLVEPSFSSDQRKRLELELNEDQKKLILSRTKTGYRRIKGSAGSGKSVVLAARAAELFSEGKEVLVITYNITLINYLKDFAVRWKGIGGKVRGGITWMNFHSWCKRVCYCDEKDKYRQLWIGCEDAEQTLNRELPELVESVLKDSETAVAVQKYDAILVDEGQDVRPSWWKVLRMVCQPGGEMILVADTTQDIYGVAKSWTEEAMIGAGFSGGWSVLKVSYRLPFGAVGEIRRFADQFLPKDTLNMPESKQMRLDEIEPCFLKWVHTSSDNIMYACEKAIHDMLIVTKPSVIAIADLTVLTANIKSGLEIVNLLDQKGVRVIHTYDLDKKESRRKKLIFYMGDARVKATTIQSFKGWESRALVMLIEKITSKEDLALIYTGMTRLKGHPEGSHLTVVSCIDELKEYGKSWDYEEI
ncbi:MAG: UvrD-helicase domain-containing protein [Betaproteobacteria bacterium]|nr:UvrD-helicase domain-containing protein [Betaproteobacteria bacterium]